MSNAVSTTWPSGSANGGWPQEPTGMLMPGRIQGWPAGTQRAANPATTLLSQAVAWWDVEQYRDGDRFLRNRGTGGELLDLRLGSSIVANSNDPLYLSPDASGSGFVYVPVTSTDLVSVPDEAALQLSGDVEIVFRIKADSYASGTQVIVTKGNTAATSNYRVNLTSAGAVSFTVGDGTTAYTATSATVGLTAGVTYWIKATRVAATGLCSFYYAADSVDEPSSWTTVSTGVASGFSGTPTNPAVLVSFGGTMAGGLFRCLVRNGIDGTTVLDIDCDAITSGSATSFTASTNQTVNVNRSTSGRKSVAMPSRHKGGRPVMALGTDDFLEIPAENGWQHGLLNFDTGQSFTVLMVMRRFTSAGSAFYFTKRGGVGVAGGAGAGWYLYGSTGLNAVFRSDDITNNTWATNTVPTSGLLTPLFGLKNRAIKTIDANVLGTSASTSDAATGSLVNTITTRIGAPGGGASTTMDGEFYGAAVWRRILTSAEMKTISDEMTRRIA